MCPGIALGVGFLVALGARSRPLTEPPYLHTTRSGHRHPLCPERLSQMGRAAVAIVDVSPTTAISITVFSEPGRGAFRRSSSFNSAKQRRLFRGNPFTINNPIPLGLRAVSELYPIISVGGNRDSMYDSRLLGPGMADTKVPGGFRIFNDIDNWCMKRLSPSRELAHRSPRRGESNTASTVGLRGSSSGVSWQQHHVRYRRFDGRRTRPCLTTICSVTGRVVTIQTQCLPTGESELTRPY